MNDNPDSTFLVLRQASHRLGVPIAWLREEAEHGRVPCLRTGRRLLFNVDQVRDTLKARAHEEAAARASDRTA